MSRSFSLGPISALTSVILAAGANALHAQGSQVEASDSMAVAATVDQYHEALTSGDSSTAAHLLAPDAVVLESGGRESKSEYLSHHLPADIAFAQAVTRERSPISVTVIGDVAWAISTSLVRGQFRDREINSRGAELMVLVRTTSGWRISAIHWSSRANRS